MAEPACPTDFIIDTRQVDHDIVVIAITGELDLLTAPQAETVVREIITSSTRHLVLNLTRVGFLSSAGIGLLLAAQRDIEVIGGQLHLVGITGNAPVERPLSIVGVLDRFAVATGLEPLLRSIRPANP